MGLDLMGLTHLWKFELSAWSWTRLNLGVIVRVISTVSELALYRAAKVELESCLNLQSTGPFAGSDEVTGMLVVVAKGWVVGGDPCFGVLEKHVSHLDF